MLDNDPVSPRTAATMLFIAEPTAPPRAFVGCRSPPTPRGGCRVWCCLRFAFALLSTAAVSNPALAHMAMPATSPAKPDAKPMEVEETRFAGGEICRAATAGTAFW
mgnify:FL=1